MAFIVLGTVAVVVEAAIVVIVVVRSCRSVLASPRREEIHRRPMIQRRSMPLRVAVMVFTPTIGRMKMVGISSRIGGTPVC